MVKKVEVYDVREDEINPFHNIGTIIGPQFVLKLGFALNTVVQNLDEMVAVARGKPQILFCFTEFKHFNHGIVILKSNTFDTTSLGIKPSTNL